MFLILIYLIVSSIYSIYMYNALCLYNSSDVVYLFTFIGNSMNVNQKIMMKVYFKYFKLPFFGTYRTQSYALK